MEIAGQLAAIPLFEGLPAEQHRTLGRIALARSYRKGQMVFAEGDPGNGFYVVQSGRIKVFKISPEGKEQILHMFGPGDSFGEVAVFTGKGFPAFAAAEAPCRLLFFARDAFVALIRRDPSLALNMLAILSQRLHKFAALIEDLSLREVPARLAAHLLYLCEKDPEAGRISLDISKGQLASLLGTIPETLSRIMSRMSHQGLIRMERNQLTVLDRQALQEIATEGKKLTPHGKSGRREELR